jgi:hypothetical protein
MCLGLPLMKPIHKIILISFLLLVDSCITPLIPKTNEDKELLVVEGLITDQPDTNTIKLSKSLPLGTESISVPVQGCFVQFPMILAIYFISTRKQPEPMFQALIIFRV